MEAKETITKDNYKEKTLKRAIIVCWVLLAICFVVKICGGNFFNINVENKNFVKVCNYLDNSWFRHIIYFCIYCFECYALIKIIKPQFKIKSKSCILYITIFAIDWVIKTLLDFGIIKTSFEFYPIMFMFLTYIILWIFSKNWWKPILVMLYQLLLVTITSIIKTISFISQITSSFLHTTIFCIDYYLLLLLTVLYVVLLFRKKNKGESYGTN